ncbi:MAG: hypothetical protein JXA66_03535 [Oligoflexia bacterium]|nr:hypothetical protein [Oligoflexia bacterium]
MLAVTTGFAVFTDLVTPTKAAAATLNDTYATSPERILYDLPEMGAEGICRYVAYNQHLSRMTKAVIEPAFNKAVELCESGQLEDGTLSAIDEQTGEIK